jgi:hypothetical protein
VSDGEDGAAGVRVEPPHEQSCVVEFGMTWTWDTILLALIAIVLIRESVIKHYERALERFSDERRRQKCANAYNIVLYRNFTRWLDNMTADGYDPQFVQIRELTPDECGIEKWHRPDDFLEHRHRLATESSG